MKAGKTTFLWGLFFAAAGLFPSGCGTPSEEARVREFLKETVALAEKKQIGALMDRFSPDYSDFEGRRKTDAEDLIGDYVGRFRGIVIHLLSARVDVAAPEGRAAVECEMSFSHGAAEVLRKLISYSGEFYRFRFELDQTEKGEWRFAYAEWRSVDLLDLFPESREILRKLFPDL